MDCKEWMFEAVEGARTGAPPRRDLAEHLAACTRCAARWETEVELNRGLAAVRDAASRLRSTDSARARLMAAFDERRLAVAARRRFVWALAATAALLLVALWIVPSKGRPRAPIPQLDDAVEELLAGNGFVPVPYAPPLAQGEIVEVVRMDLTPAAFARMGFVVQPPFGSELTADLMVGQDGLPRAVRLVETDKESL
jgi:hypothetical protein